MNNQNLVEDIKPPQKPATNQPDINSKSANNIADFNAVSSKPKKSNKAIVILVACLIVVILVSLAVVAYFKSPHN